jgi:hypothetical protein
MKLVIIKSEQGNHGADDLWVKYQAPEGGDMAYDVKIYFKNDKKSSFVLLNIQATK